MKWGESWQLALKRGQGWNVEELVGVACACKGTPCTIKLMRQSERPGTAHSKDHSARAVVRRATEVPHHGLDKGSDWLGAWVYPGSYQWAKLIRLRLHSCKCACLVVCINSCSRIEMLFGSMHQNRDVTLIINNYFYWNSYSKFGLVYKNIKNINIKLV
jgi:hypothetical protein